MAHAKGLSDFVLTGCAIVPVITVVFGNPELALLSHIVLLFSGLLFAGSEEDAPLRQPERDLTQLHSAQSAANAIQSASTRASSRSGISLQGRTSSDGEYLRRTSSVDSDLD